MEKGSEKFFIMPPQDLKWNTPKGGNLLKQYFISH